MANLASANGFPLVGRPLMRLDPVGGKRATPLTNDCVFGSFSNSQRKNQQQLEEMHTRSALEQWLVSLHHSVRLAQGSHYL
jgi:hypothetical protein